MKKPTSTKQLAFSTTTVRPLQGDDLAKVNGGSISVYNPSGGITSLNTSLITSIKYNPSGG
jgi:hypothetical protein